jgi:hypothetical protein
MGTWLRALRAGPAVQNTARADRDAAARLAPRIASKAIASGPLAVVRPPRTLFGSRLAVARRQPRDFV